jgi:hypothetical protein
MGIVPLGVALMVSFVSAISILGISAEIYTYGMQFVMYYNGMIIATLVVSYLYLPVFFQLNAMSVYEVNNSPHGHYCPHLRSGGLRYCQSRGIISLGKLLEKRRPWPQ